ncbi:hypothetical protein [Streptomyces sp. NPDC006459]|uniref:hypothetical protein n=1 Tax=Streptomyces sp. NPDC006459 TaxID=3154303 RepID=UPI0033A18ADD
MADEMASLLRTLRVRAGDPSYRTIERLISTQPRRGQMRRATIQEKITGKSSADLVQVLSIVEALSDYARSMGAPLADEEVDPRVWRDRFSEIADKGNSHLERAASAVSTADKSRPEWIMRHLRTAGMHDVIDFVNASQQRPLAEWLPEVIHSLKKAKMSLIEFLDPASRQSVPALVETVVALDAGCGGPVGGLDDPAQVMLHYAAKNHPAESVPVIVVALRRADMEAFVPGFIGSVAQVASAPTLLVVIDALRSASLSSDASEVLAAVGSKRKPDQIIDVVDLLHVECRDEDSRLILEEIGGMGPGVITDFCLTIPSSRANRAEILDRIANGMDWSEPERYMKYFEKNGEYGMANVVREGIEEFERLKKNTQL